MKTTPLSSKFYVLCSHRGGQATLTLAFVVGGTVVLIGATLAFIVISFINSSFAFQSANRALAAAAGGAEDAVLQLVRNKDFLSTGYCVPAASLPCPDSYAQVVISRLFSSQAVITSRAIIGGSQRRLEIVVVIDPVTYKITVISWRQLAI